jgi:NAD(P)H-dependent FMN reductase
MRSLSVLPVSGKLYPLKKGGRGSSEGLDWGDRGALASQPAFSSQGGMQMAASDQTIREVLRIIRKHVNQPTLEKIMDELLDVPGNESFRETIQKLAEAVQDQKNP